MPHLIQKYIRKLFSCHRCLRPFECLTCSLTISREQNRDNVFFRRLTGRQALILNALTKTSTGRMNPLWHVQYVDCHLIWHTFCTSAAFYDKKTIYEVNNEVDKARMGFVGSLSGFTIYISETWQYSMSHSCTVQDVFHIHSICAVAIVCTYVCAYVVIMNMINSSIRILYQTVPVM